LSVITHVAIGKGQLVQVVYSGFLPRDIVKKHVTVFDEQCSHIIAVASLVHWGKSKIFLYFRGHKMK